MTLTISFAPEETGARQARALAEGISAEQYFAASSKTISELLRKGPGAVLPRRNTAAKQEADLSGKF